MKQKVQNMFPMVQTSFGIKVNNILCNHVETIIILCHDEDGPNNYAGLHYSVAFSTNLLYRVLGLPQLLA
jgi:hypothetical protein